MPVAGRAVDRNAVVHKVLAGIIDIVDTIREVAKVAAIRGQALITVPVVGQLNMGVFLSGGRHENQGKPALFVFIAACLFEAEQFVKRDRGIKVADPNHCVQIGNRHGKLS